MQILKLSTDCIGRCISTDLMTGEVQVGAIGPQGMFVPHRQLVRAGGKRRGNLFFMPKRKTSGRKRRGKTGRLIEFPRA
ncbi:MAG: hypothetical protein WBE45_11010 [Terriglobales bacterium]